MSTLSRFLFNCFSKRTVLAAIKTSKIKTPLKIQKRTMINSGLAQHYFTLPLPKDKIIVTYVWIDGTKEFLRNKERILSHIPKTAKDCPDWNFDGSSTGQAQGNNSDVTLKPVTLYKDPFKRGDHRIVLCETYDSDNKPLPSNTRASCFDAMKKTEQHELMFGLEQEYSFLDIDLKPLGWPKFGTLPPQGPYYCGVGANKVFGREIMDTHFWACLYSNLRIEGTNIEVKPSQFEFQIGPAGGIEVSDDMWMARYFLHRIAEDFGAVVTLDPKICPDWNGAGAHCNFSTKEMRAEGGLKYIMEAIEKLKNKHSEHMKVYDIKGGFDNMRRLTGKHETSSIDKFSFGVADRGASIRINRKVSYEKKGFLEDRRPASNADPYEVTDIMARTTLL